MNRSISQRLKKASTPELKQKILADWIKNWDVEITALLDRLGRAVAHDDFDTVCKCIGQLRAVHDKKMHAIKSILILTDK